MLGVKNWQQWVHLPVAVAVTVAAVALRAFNPSDFAVLAAYYLGAAMHTTIAWGTAIRQSRIEREHFREEVETETLPAAERRILEGVDERLTGEKGVLPMLRTEIAAVRAAIPPAPVIPPYPAFPEIPDYGPKFALLEGLRESISKDVEERLAALPDFEDLRSGISQDVEGLKSRVEERLATFNDKAATITSRLDLTDQKLGTAIDAALKRELPQIEQRLAVLMGQQVQAGFARFQGQADRQVDEFTSQLADLTPRERLMMRMLKRNVGAKNAATVADLAALLKQQRGGPQQGGGQGGAPMGSIVPHPQSPTGWLQLTPQGWQPFQMPGQQPAYPGFGQAPAFPGGPAIPTPGAGAPPGYAPAPPALAPGASITPSGVAPPLPPPPKEVDRRAAEEAAEADAEPAEPSSEAEPTPVPE